MASLFEHHQNQNPRAPPAHAEIQIAGYSVRFPAGKKPFPAQFGVMNTALKALHSSQNALIESPTGTGKTLALLASCLSWQREHYFRCRRKKKKRVLVAQPQHATASVNAVGFEKRESSVVSVSVAAGGAAAAATSAATATIDTTIQAGGVLKRRIYFASRTHSQLSQVINEMKKCHSALEWKDHRPNAVVLASRRHYCINDKVSSLRPHSRIGNACRSLLEAHACQYAKRAAALTAKADRLCDIEDLVAAGRKHKACPYYASQDMAQAPTSSIVLCPYNYLIDPIIRRAMNIDVTNAIIVFDEGHNIAGLLREAASVDVPLASIDDAYRNLCALASGARNRRHMYASLRDVVAGLRRMLRQFITSGGGGGRGHILARRECVFWGGRCVQAGAVLRPECAHDPVTPKGLQRGVGCWRGEWR